MKRATKLVILMAAIALVAVACGSSSANLEGRKVTVAVENLYPPFNFIDETTNQGAGFDYDIWNEICSRISCQASFVEATWPDVILETGQGVYDTAADGISITEERKAVVAFSDSYMSTIQRIMVRTDETRFSDADAFFASGAKLGTQVGTTNYELATTLTEESNIDAYDSFPTAVLALLSGDVDGVIIDDIAGQGYQGEGSEGVRMLDGDLQSDPLGFIYPIGSDLIEPVNQAIADMKKDGTLDRLITKWFIDYTP